MAVTNHLRLSWDDPPRYGNDPPTFRTKGWIVEGNAGKHFYAMWTAPKFCHCVLVLASNTSNWSSNEEFQMKPWNTKMECGYVHQHEPISSKLLRTNWTNQKEKIVADSEFWLGTTSIDIKCSLMLLIEFEMCFTFGLFCFVFSESALSWGLVAYGAAQNINIHFGVSTWKQPTKINN